MATFTEFVKAFSVFGAEMVELAHITGKFKNFPAAACVLVISRKFSFPSLKLHEVRNVKGWKCNFFKKFEMINYYGNSKKNSN